MSEIVLIKPFTMDLYSLISCIPMSTSRNVTVFKVIVIIFFYFSNILWLCHEHIFMKQNFRAILALPIPTTTPRLRFNVEYTWCICRNLKLNLYSTLIKFQANSQNTLCAGSHFMLNYISLTISWRKSLSYRN